MTKSEKIQQLEEQLKKMSNVKLTTTMKQSYKGGSYEIPISDYNKRKNLELMPQSRRPKAISKAHAYKLEKLGDDYETKKD
jgi:hypothetical protein